MKKTMRSVVSAGILVPMLAGLSMAAPVGTSFVYQGRLTDNGSPANGLYDFEIVLHDEAVAATPVGSPTTVTLNDVQVTNGLYTVTLNFGSFVNRDEDLYLQIGIRPGASVGAYTALTPRRQLTIAPHSARTLDDAYEGGGSGLGRTITSTPGLPVVIDRSGGSVQFNNASPATIQTFSGATEKARIWGPTFGEVQLFDTSGTFNVLLSSSGESGGLLNLDDGSDANRVLITAPTTGGTMTLNNAATTTTVRLDGGAGSVSTTTELTLESTIGGTEVATTELISGGGISRFTDSAGSDAAWLGYSGTSGGFATLFQADGDAGLRLDGDDGGDFGGEIEAFQADGGFGVRVDGDAGTDAGGIITVYQADGGIGMNVDGDSGGAGLLSVNNIAGSATVSLDGDDGNGGRLGMTDGTNETIFIDANSTEGGGLISMDNSANVRTIFIDSDATDDGRILIEDQGGADAINMHADGAASGGEIEVYDSSAGISIEIQGQDADGGTGGQINLYNGLGTRTIQIDGDVGNDGRVITNELQITGGSDLSEQFDIAGPAGLIVPGSVVCIDVNNPGKLRVSDSAYCPTVAGIISGANGIETGMLMGQKDSEADGVHAVALTGRVYCLVDATRGAVRPGDLLTTSDTPGHAMRVSDHSRAHGAIIGKAMTGLDGGTGMVLVLVSLQ